MIDTKIFTREETHAFVRNEDNQVFTVDVSHEGQAVKPILKLGKRVKTYGSGYIITDPNNKLEDNLGGLSTLTAEGLNAATTTMKKYIGCQCPDL